jgi:hypothetical protein
MRSAKDPEHGLGVLDLGTYLTYITEPGTIKLWIVSMSSKELKVEAVAGQIYYVTAGLNPVLFGPPIPGSFLDLKPREDARKEIAGCKPLPE